MMHCNKMKTEKDTNKRIKRSAQVIAEGVARVVCLGNEQKEKELPTEEAVVVVEDGN